MRENAKSTELITTDNKEAEKAQAFIYISSPVTTDGKRKRGRRKENNKPKVSRE